MINIIWEETLGSSQSQDDSSEGIKDDNPFEFKYSHNLTASEMEIGFAPLNLSNFPGHSNELPEIFWYAFNGDHDNVMHHVEWFMTLASKYRIKEEDVYMRSFVLHLGEKALTWFVGLDKGTIPSFAELVETFCNH